ncbi:PopZ family protein [Rhizobium paknamense]|uniref:Cell pole-organizing protein PopZ n=1 Tax=Rhizobium paknamense TaxID=1206817 RepID=A0ABU0IIE1_9HYPH|nr:PopZ family protein [Rhizobium paknamense]MDQ0457190.1 cell pole-organizing protein PopZ [Rhizobium paknamense]
MAQPNVSREPSMEEILASIRRIIESNEAPSGRPYDAASAFESDMAGHETDDFASTPMDLPVPANQPGPAFGAEAQPHQQPQQKNVSLADLAARVRAASERGEDDMQDLPQPPALRPVSAPSPEPYQARETDFGGAQPFSQPRFAEPPAPQQAEEPMPQTEPENRGLLSLQAGAQVARSFEELAAAVDGQQRRSLDEIAQEMLRPMLQDWLDDNLPTLVERLVREEIERIARGPRR